MKELLLSNKKKIIALIVTGLTAVGVAIKPELGLLIAEGIDAVEQVIRGISDVPVE